MKIPAPASALRSQSRLTRKQHCLLRTCGWSSCSTSKPRSAGFSPAGLPMGFQIIAPVQQELACLHLAAAYEAAAPWVAKHPPPLLKA